MLAKMTHVTHFKLWNDNLRKEITQWTYHIIVTYIRHPHAGNPMSKLIMSSVCLQYSSCIQFIHSFSVCFGVIRNVHSSRSLFRYLLHAVLFLKKPGLFLDIWGYATNVTPNKTFKQQLPMFWYKYTEWR